MPAAAQSVWFGGESNDWFAAGNWGGGVPAGGVDAFIAVPSAPFQPLIDGALALASDVHVGFDGTQPAGGSLTIQNGGVLSGYNSFLGYAAGAATGLATAMVSGTGTQWNNTGQMIVGHSHTGVLSIQNGGAVYNDIGIVGNQSGGTGYVTLFGTGFGTGALWANNSALSVGQDGTGSVTVTNGGTLEVALGTGAVSLAANAGSSGTLTIGQEGAFPPAAAGVVRAAQISFGDGDGQLVFNHTNTGYLFDLLLVGNGGVLNRAGTTLYTGDGSAFTGTTTIMDGRFHVDGQLMGVIEVDGGVLGGTGDADDVSVNGGGTLAPGASIGTLGAAQVSFDAGSVFEVELNDGGNTAGANNDLLDASGIVAINGGTVRVRPANGSDDGSTYTPGLTYTIISAGAVDGRFDAVTDDYPLLAFADSYDASNVYLTSAAASACPAGLTFNQDGTCGGVLSIGSGGLYNAVLNLSSADLPAALDALSGEMHASVGTTFLEDSRFVRQAALDRLRLPISAATPAEDRSMTHALDQPGMGASDASPNGLWGRAFGAWGRWAADGNSGRTRRTVGGVFLGGDAPISEHLRLGVLAGYGRSDLEAASRASTGTVDSWHLGAYGGAVFGDLGLRFGGAYAWHDVATMRSVVFTGFGDGTSAGYDGATAQLFGEAGYRLGLGAVRLEPFAGIAHVQAWTNGFTETGGPAALTAGGLNLETTFTTLGLRAETDIALGAHTRAGLTGMVGWRHAFGDVAPLSTHRFAGGAPFAVAGVPLAEDLLVVELGLALSLTPDLDIALSYDGAFGAGLSDQSVRASLHLRF